MDKVDGTPTPTKELPPCDFPKETVEDCGACSDRTWAEEGKCCPWVRDGGALYTCESCRAARKHIGRCEKGKASKGKGAGKDAK